MKLPQIEEGENSRRFAPAPGRPRSRRLQGIRARMALVALVALLLLPNAARAAVDPAADGLEKARQLMEKGDAKSAAIVLKNLARDNPNNAEVRYELGSVELSLGDYVTAESQLSKAIELHYPNGSVNAKLATAMLAQGKFQKLLDTVQPCPDDNQCKGDVFAMRTRARLALKDEKGADADSVEAMKATPNGLASRISRAMVLAAESKNTEAEQVVDGILATNPKVADVLSLKGDLRRQASDFSGATKFFEESLQVNPNDINTRMHLALALIALNKNDEAKSQIDQVLEVAPKSVLGAYLKGLILARDNKMAEALDVVRPMETGIAQDPRGQFLLALIHAGNKNLEQALAYAAQYHASKPDDLTGSKLLANINFQLGAYDQVVAILEPLRDRLANDADALDVLGSAYLAQGQLKEANEILSDAVKLRPENLAIRGKLAVSRSRNSETREEGIHELEGLVQSNPKASGFDLALIASYLAAGDLDRALTETESLIERQPNAPMPLLVRGAVRLAKKDVTGARADFKASLEKDPTFVPAALYLAELDIRNGDFDGARGVMDSILKKNAADLRALLARAQIEIRAGNVAAAIPFYERAIDAHPKDLDPRRALLQILLSQKNKDRAILVAEDLGHALPNDFTAVDLAARALFDLGKPDEGLAMYQQLAAARPDSPQVHVRLAEIYIARGDFANARTACDRAISANPAYMPAWINRVAVEYKLSGLEAALLIVDKAQKLNPTNGLAKLLRGDLYVTAKRLPEAEAEYQRIFAKDPSSLLVVRIFDVIKLRGDRARATSFVQDWLKKNPNDLVVHLALGEDELQSKDMDAAKAEYEFLASKLPRDVRVINNLAWIYERLGDQRATKLAEQAYTLAPSSPQVVDTYAYLLYRNGDPKRGAELMRQAYNANPHDPYLAYHMAVILSDMKETTEAKAILKQLVDSKVSFEDGAAAKSLLDKLGGG